MSEPEEKGTLQLFDVDTGNPKETKQVVLRVIWVPPLFAKIVKLTPALSSEPDEIPERK